MNKEMSTGGYHSAWVQEVAFEITKEMKYNPKCLCNNTCCARHSNCRACLEFHKLTDHPPTCRYRWSKSAWDSLRL